MLAVIVLALGIWESLYTNQKSLVALTQGIDLGSNDT